MHDDRAWLAHALEMYGTHEVAGPASHPLIAEALALVGFAGADDSEIAWCSAAMCLCMERAGLRSTRQANARSWLGWGDPSGPRVGAVTVLWRVSPDDWRGHVGLLLHRSADGQRLLLVSGNHRDSVDVAWYPHACLLGYRWPSAPRMPTA